jgi:hypothetical protein
MPTRTDVRFRVVPILFLDKGYTIFDDGLAPKFLQPTFEEARTIGDQFLADLHSNVAIYTIRREESTRNASPEECTDEELCQAWRVWRAMDNLPMRYDPMDVADPYLNFPGDMEMYSDMFNEYAKEFGRRHEDEDVSISDVA